ncbi:MAG: hypothetical protein QGG64_23805, partial [Candidatus Latescibacteria bacterium]|nr:hypothetical protein [Candidatus Latescibacterota bacterium]
MKAEEIISRLERLRQTGPGRWIARCPAHEDHNPSLNIREVDDRILIKCWAGCGAADVVSALGLQMSDLFTQTPANTTQIKPHERW